MNKPDFRYVGDLENVKFDGHNAIPTLKMWLWQT